jgi:hypothetical protein
VIYVVRTPQPKELQKNADRWLLKLQEISGDANSTKKQEAITLLQEASTPSAEYSAFAIAHILPYLIQTMDVAKY